MKIKKFNQLITEATKSPKILNITEIIERGDVFERSFFQWLNDKKIKWFQKGRNLNFIYLDNETDYTKIKKTWDEIN